MSAKHILRRRFEQAASDFDTAAVLHRTVADELIRRLDVVRFLPQRILDLGCGTGYSARVLGRRYRRAHIIGVDGAFAMAARARRNAGWFARTRYVGGDAESLPFADAVFDMVLSNLMLPWCYPSSVFAETLRVLRPGGLFVFTSLGPDTLQEIRRAWQAVDDGAHVNAFADMHDLGDALIHAGFADPIMDIERYTLTYPDVRSVLREIKTLGVGNVHPSRQRGLMAGDRFDRFLSAYAALADDGRIPATVEVVYGHAWVPEQQRTRQGSAVTIPIDRIRRRR